MVSKHKTYVEQSGVVTPGHLATWTTDGVVQDGGQAISQGSGGPFLPLIGGTMDGDTDIVCWPVANSPDPSQPGSPNAVRSMLIAQSETKLDSTFAEWTAVFGNYVNSGQPNGQKVSVYIGAVQGPLGGTTWSLNTDTVRNALPSGVPGGPGGVGSGSPGTPGAIPIANGTIGYELDFTNWDQDCAPGGAFVVGMYVHNQSTFASLAGIYWDSNPEATPANFAWHNGIMFTGDHTIEDNTIFDGTNSVFSYQAEGTRTGTTFYANDVAPHAFQANGNHSISDFWASDNAPTVLQVSGTHSFIIEMSAATITQHVISGLCSSPWSMVDGMLTATQWQNQGSYVGWNESVGSGRTDFVNSYGLGAGGFNFWNTASTPSSTPTLLASLDSLGYWQVLGSLGVWNTTPPNSKPTVSGSRGGNAALASLITALASYGLITDGTTV